MTWLLHDCLVVIGILGSGVALGFFASALFGTGLFLAIAFSAGYTAIVAYGYLQSGRISASSV